MATKIRLTRMGKKRSPFYRIIVVDERDARDGKYIDLIGTFNPKTDDEKLRLKYDADKIHDWLKKGAQLSEVMTQVFSDEGLIKQFTESKGTQKKTKSRKKTAKSIASEKKRKESVATKAKNKKAYEKALGDKKKAAEAEAAKEAEATEEKTEA